MPTARINTFAGRKLPSGVVASPEQTLTAESEWSTEDFVAAEPYPMPEISAEMISEYLEKAEEQLSKGNTSPGGMPEESPDSTDDSQPTAGHPYPPPFNQHEVFTPYTTYPYITVGKLFFKQSGGSYVASAASIGNSAIWTAGHCVHAGNNQPGGWSTNMVFVPGYKDGAAPRGQFTVRQLACRTNWYQKGNPGGLFEDMGVAVVNPLNGKTLGQTVGWLGFAWNFGRNQVWT